MWKYDDELAMANVIILQVYMLSICSIFQVLLAELYMLLSISSCEASGGWFNPMSIRVFIVFLYQVTLTLEGRESIKDCVFK